jgi:hypothetical protein
MLNYRKLLESFPVWREEKLKTLLRHDGFEVMYYRPSVFFHTLRVYAMVQRVIPIAEDIFYFSQVPFEGELALAIAMCHDDPEMVTGDPSVIKKDHMSAAQRKELDQKGLEAIDMLATDMPTMFMGYIYKRLLMHAHRKDCIEAQLVKWLDWLDACCEIQHELFAGNMLFVRALMRTVAGTASLKETYPGLAPLLERGDSAFLQVGFDKHVTPFVRSLPYAHLGKPHTRQSIALATDFPLYNAWRQVVVDDLGEEGIAWLTTQVEGAEQDSGTNRPRVLTIAS